jgi:hypothetical protein
MAAPVMTGAATCRRSGEQKMDVMAR